MIVKLLKMLATETALEGSARQLDKVAERRDLTDVQRAGLRGHTDGLRGLPAAVDGLEGEELRVYKWQYRKGSELRRAVGGVL